MSKTNTNEMKLSQNYINRTKTALNETIKNIENEEQYSEDLQAKGMLKRMYDHKQKLETIIETGEMIAS